MLHVFNSFLCSVLRIQSSTMPDLQTPGLDSSSRFMVCAGCSASQADSQPWNHHVVGGELSVLWHHVVCVAPFLPPPSRISCWFALHFYHIVSVGAEQKAILNIWRRWFHEMRTARRRLRWNQVTSMCYQRRLTSKWAGHHPASVPSLKPRIDEGGEMDPWTNRLPRIQKDPSEQHPCKRSAHVWRISSSSTQEVEAGLPGCQDLVSSGLSKRSRLS